MITLPKVKIELAGIKAAFSVSGNTWAAIRACLDKDGNAAITIGRVRKLRSGQSNKAGHGWAADIALQLEIEQEEVYQAMKRMAVSEGYPSRYNHCDGKEEPESSANVSQEQYNVLLNVIKRFADEHGLWLTETIDGQAVRTRGGEIL